MNNSTVSVSTTTEFQYSFPTVIIDGQVVDYVTVVAIEDNFGFTPSKCVIRVGANLLDFNGPITLNALGFTFGFGSRIIVVDDDGNVLFVGNILKRHDQSGARTNNVLFTALDDRVFLSQMFMRGCLVYDPPEDDGPSVKFIRRYTPRMNPEGYWNCVGANINGAIYPVFAPKAIMGSVYQSPEQAFPPDLAEGQLTAWTPRRALLYQNLLCTIDSEMGIQGITDSEWRSLTASDRLIWTADSINNMVGTDVPTDIDPLDRKLPDYNFRGQAIARAVKIALDTAGTHDMQITYGPLDDDGTCQSMIGFEPISYSAAAGTGTQSIQVPCVRGGPLGTSYTVHEFDVMDDASSVKEVALAEGAPVMLETSCTNYETEGEEGQGVNCFIPAWTDADKTNHLQIVNGGPLTSPPKDRQYAKYPSTQGTQDTDMTSWLTADGDGGRPLIIARTAEAAHFAWTMYPYVFKGYTIDSQALANAGVMGGVDDIYGDQSVYPVLTSARPISSEQLQFFINNPKESGVQVQNWLRERYPINLQLFQDNGDITNLAAPKIRNPGNDVLIIEGLDINVNGKVDCLYSGDMLLDPSTCDAKDFIINVALPLDHRVMGTASIQPNTSWLTPDYTSQLGGGPMIYIDSPDAYHESHQVNSTPTSFTQFIGGADGDTPISVPLTRILPPGSEQPSAEFAAQRALFSEVNPDRVSSWRIVGIRPEYRAGLWVENITMIHNEDDSPPDEDFEVEAPIKTVLYDFQSQETVLNGLLNMTRGTQAHAPHGSIVGVSNNPAALKG